MLLAGLLIVLGDVFFSRYMVMVGEKSDLVEYYLPMRLLGFSELRHGHLMLWNPYVYGGEPFLGNTETALLYPLNFVFLFLSPPHALNVIFTVHLLLIGWFTYLWTAGKGYDSLACLTGAFVVMLGGAYFPEISIGHLSNLCTITWIPLLFFTIDRWIESQRLSWLLLGILGGSMMVLAGHPQYLLFFFGIGLVYTVCVAGKNIFIPAIWSGFLLMGVGCVALTAVQWLPALLATQHSIRGAPLSYLNASGNSVSIEALLTFLMPFFWGGGQVFPYWGLGYFPSNCFFAGTFSVFFVFYALFMDRGKTTKILGALAILSLLFSFITYMPFFHLLYSNIPGIDYLRSYSKLNFFNLFFVGALVACGLSRFRNKGILESVFAKFLILSGGLLVLLGLLLAFDFWAGQGSKYLRIFNETSWGRDISEKILAGERENFLRTAERVQAISAIVAGGGIFLLGVLMFFWKNISRMSVLLSVMTIVELIFFARLTRSTFDYRIYNNKVLAIENFLKSHPGDYRVLGTYGENVQPFGKDIWGLNPFVPIRYAKWMALNERESCDSLILKRISFHYYPTSLGMVRLRYILRDEINSLGVYPIGLPEMPRAQLLDRWIFCADENEALDSVALPNFRPDREAVLEGRGAFQPPASVQKGNSVLEIRDSSTDSIEIRAETKHLQLLVLGENYEPGWKVIPFKDDSCRSYQVIPADYFLRGVFLQPGKHHFKMIYRPIEFIAGKWISAFSFCLYFLVLVFYFFNLLHPKGENNQWR